MDHARGERLAASERALCEAYDLAMFDLDGVVYVGSGAVPGAPETIAKARAAGMRTAFVTNNASRPPSAVAAHLDELGVPAGAGDVVTSAQAAARLLRERVPAGSAVLVVGGPGLVEAVHEQGLRAVGRLEESPDAVVQGFGRDVGWQQLAEAVHAVDAGLPWIATNLDASVPTPRGRAPGNGALVDVVASTTGRRPVVAGKPDSGLFDETLLRVGGRRPLVVGDRIDTDIEGAVACDLDSLLVLTGVTDVPTLCAAPKGSRPSYLAHGLDGLLAAHPHVEVDRGRATCGGWRAEVCSPAEVALVGSGSADDALRSLVSACWAHVDRNGEAPTADVVDTAWRQVAR